MEPRALRNALTERLAREPGVVAAWLFGSRARGEARAESDVDVAVLLDAPPEPTLAGLPLDLEDDLVRVIGLPVQVVVVNRAPADLVYRVLRDGVLLVDRQPARRIAFEVRARNERFDMQRIWSEYRRGPAA